MTSRILIVDDSATIRRALELILRPKGFELELAATGTEAIERARSFRPTLVVLDYVLPDMRGPDVCSALESLPETAATPFVLVSAKGASVREAYRNARNVVSYITKPFKPALVVSVVENALSSRPTAPPRAAMASAAGPGVPETPLGNRHEAVVDTLLRHALEGLAIPVGSASVLTAPAEARSQEEMREGIARLCRLLDAGREGLGTGQGRWVVDPRGALVSIDEILLDAHRQLCSLTRSLPSPVALRERGTAVLALAPPDAPGARALAELARTIDEPRLFVAPNAAAFDLLAHLLQPCAVVLPDLPPTHAADVIGQPATTAPDGPRRIRLVQPLPASADPASCGPAAAFPPDESATELRVGITELAATLRDLIHDLATERRDLPAGSAAEILEVLVL